MKPAWKQIMRERIQIAGTAAAIVLGSLNPKMPELDLSRPIVFERTIDGTPPGHFDAKEIVARRIIITLPLDDAIATSGRSWFNPN